MRRGLFPKKQIIGGLNEGEAEGAIWYVACGRGWKSLTEDGRVGNLGRRRNAQDPGTIGHSK